jgi:hypothetical protein
LRQRHHRSDRHKHQKHRRLPNVRKISWGAFMGGFDLTISNPNGTTGCARSSQASPANGGPETDYIIGSRFWGTTAVIIMYDDSDGWYDHQMGPIVKPSAATGANASDGPIDNMFDFDRDHRFGQDDDGRRGLFLNAQTGQPTPH